MYIYLYLHEQLISDVFSRSTGGGDSSAGSSSSGSGSSAAEALKRNRTEQFMDILDREFAEKVTLYLMYLP